LVLHLSRVSRPLHRRLRHHAGGVLPGDHHLVRDRPARARQPRDAEVHVRQGAARRAVIYALLALWALISLFPIYWTLTTSFKTAVDVTQGHLVPWLDFEPDWRGWGALRPSPGRGAAGSPRRPEIPVGFSHSNTPARRPPPPRLFTRAAPPHP